MKQNRLLILFLILSAGLLSACGTSVYNLSPEEQMGATRMVYYSPYDDVFTATVQQLQEGQGVIDNVDRESGIINTDWVQDDSAFRQFMIGASRARTSITVSDQGENQTEVFVRLFMQSQGNFGGWVEQAVGREQAKEALTPFFQGIHDRLGE